MADKKNKDEFINEIINVSISRLKRIFRGSLSFFVKKKKDAIVKLYLERAETFQPAKEQLQQ